MKKLFLILLLLPCCLAFSQNWPVKQLVTDKLNAGADFKRIPAFSFSATRTLAARGTYSELKLQPDFISTIIAQKPGALQIEIPLDNRQTITCQLVKASFGNAKITENNSRIIPGLSIPVLYRGTVSGEREKNNVILTVTDGYVSLTATFSDKAIQVVQTDTANRLAYRLYHSQQVQFPVQSLNCGTNDGSNAAISTTIPLNGTITGRASELQDKCVNVFVDCFDSLYQHFGNSRQQTLNYVYELYNLVTTGYINDSINVQVIGINIWTTTDPFNQLNSTTALNDLTFYHKDNYWGNLCVGLDWGNGRGGLGWVGKLKATTPNSCGVYRESDTSGATCYCDLNFVGNLMNFPTGFSVTQGQLEVTMHEMGHVFGSRHTHWCGWQLNATTTGAIDSCRTVENGPCTTVGTTPPPGGGTIMSYCHLLGTSFINYNNGFGLLPGNAIRNYIRNNTCVSNCMMCLINGIFPAPQNGDIATNILMLTEDDRKKKAKLPDTP